MNRFDKTLCLLLAATNGAYLSWLLLNVQGPMGYMLLYAELMLGTLSFLVLINHWNQRQTYKTDKKSSLNLDVFLTVVNEPLEMFGETLSAAANINYRHKQLYVLDDGSRPEVAALAKKAGAHYLARNNAQDFKAGNLNYGFDKSRGDVVLVLDADQVCEPNIATDLMGYFDEDQNVALVSTRQRFDVPEKDFNHDVMFYEHMQGGKNADNAAISCGSGVFYRRSSLNKVGGFQTWNIVEDLYTSYVLHQNGFKSVYINKPYTTGTAPMNLPTIYKQRGTWATDTFRLLFKKFSWKDSLSARQRLHYFELGFAYLIPAIALPVLFVLPGLSLFMNTHILKNESAYLLFRLPSLILTIAFYYRISGNTFSTGAYWTSLSPVYFKSLLIALKGKKATYQVTDKSTRMQSDVKLVLPHISVITFNFLALAYSVAVINHGHITSSDSMSLVWVSLISFWFLPVIKTGLVGHSPLPEVEYNNRPTGAANTWPVVK